MRLIVNIIQQQSQKVKSKSSDTEKAVESFPGNWAQWVDPPDMRYYVQALYGDRRIKKKDFQCNNTQAKPNL